MRNSIIAAIAVGMILTVEGEALKEGVKMDWKSLSAEVMKDNGGRTTIFGAAVTKFRELGSDRPSKIPEIWLGSVAKAGWRSQIESEFSVQQLSDFFCGAIPMTGPQNERRAIWGLYNPWWDAIMILELAVNPEGGDDASIIMVQSVMMMSGETFRNEPNEPSEKEIKHGTVVPVADPISVELWRVTASTRHEFMKMFPLEGLVTRGQFSHRLEQVDKKRDVSRILLRSSLRLKEASLLLTDPVARLKAKKLKRLLVAGTDAELDAEFVDSRTACLRDEFKCMPYLFRQKFGIYGCLKTTTGSQYLFVNRLMPRLYVTVTVGADGSGAALEWYDLIQAEQLLDAWNGRKGGAK